MTPDPGRVAAIAEGLTKAQIRRLLAVHAMEGLPLRGYGRYRLYVSTSKGPSLALEALGLLVAKHRFVASTGKVMDWGRSEITPLGLAIRDHLLAGGE